MRRSRLRRYRRTRRTGRRRTFGNALRKKNGFTRRAGYYGRYNAAFTANVPAFQQKVELKFHDTSQGDLTISEAGDISGNFLTIPQNTTENGRIGRNILLTKLMFQGELHLKQQATVTLAHDYVRIMVIWDTQANGGTATVLDVLETNDVTSFRNLANSKRFRVLYDRKHTLNAFTSTITSANVVVTARVIKPIQYFINLRIPVEYDGTTGDPPELKSNSLFALYISADGRTEIVGNYRVRYTG